jgi:hypothetical protein
MAVERLIDVSTVVAMCGGITPRNAAISEKFNCSMTEAASVGCCLR